MGHPGSIYNLSVHYRDGGVVAKDEGKVVELLQRAANMDDADAAHDLAVRVVIMLLCFKETVFPVISSHLLTFPQNSHFSSPHFECSLF
jgi:TPR repeat protein